MAFKYISAGVTPNDLKYRMFVKYKKNDVLSIEHSYDEKNKLCIMTTPDRTVWISEKDDFFPDNFDEYLSPNIYEHGSVPSKYSDHILFSAHNWKQAAKRERSEWCSNPDLKVVIDSGGAQLRFGTEKFVNPKHVIDVYNKAADIALALDIPPRPVDKDFPGHMEILAEVQRRNGEIFKKLYTGERKIRFQNVLHGFSLEQHRDWVKAVDDDFFQGGWAIGFDTYYPILNIIQVFQLLEMSTKTPTDSIHFLGVSGKSQFPYLAWFGKYVKNLTCDSSQHIHTAIRARILENFTPDGEITQWKFGDEPLMDKVRGKIKLNVIKPTPDVELPGCNPLTHALKYAAFFGFDTKTGSSNILSAHNLINNQRFSKWWVNVAENSTLEQFEKIIPTMIKSKKEARNVIEWCRVIDYTAKHGYKAALKKFDHYFKEGDSLGPKHMDVLFGEETEKRASMQNMAFRDSAVIEVLPNYLDYSELKPFMTKEQYEDCKISTYVKGKKSLEKLSREEIIAKIGKKLYKGWSLEEELEKEAKKKENDDKKVAAEVKKASKKKAKTSKKKSKAKK